MSQSLIIELSDPAYTALELRALASGVSPAKLASAALEREFVKTKAELSNAEKQLAQERFERHLGAIGLGYATGVDNEGIDADLAREYGATHEEG